MATSALSQRHIIYNQMPALNKKLAQLTTLSALEEPQRRQQEQASREQQQRVAMAMQMLGLQQQQQNATAEQGLRERALQQQGQEATMIGQNQQRKSLLDAAQMYQSIDPRVTGSILGGIPEVGTAQQQVRTGDVEHQVRTMLPVVQALQGKPELQTVLGSLSPDVQQQLLQHVQQQLPQAQPQVQSGLLENRAGGPLSGIGQSLKEYFASKFPSKQQRQENQAFNEADPLNPLNLLFGKKVK